MGRKSRAKQERRKDRHRHGRGPGGWSSVEVFEGPANGPDVVSASLEDVLAAVEAVPADLDWGTLADQVVPVFQRVRPYHPSMPEPVRIVVPPGLTVSFGVDIGPAFLAVHAGMLEGWAVTPEQLLKCGLDNLDRRIAGVAADEVLNTTIGGFPLRALQSSTGSASTYVLRPEALGMILGRHPQLAIAPMRNLLISMPVETDREFVAWLFDEFASQDPNCLAPTAFVISNGTLEVEPLGDAFGRA